MIHPPQNDPETLQDFLDYYCIASYHCGSRVTCAPAPVNTDSDILALTRTEPAAVTAMLVDLGFRFDPSHEHYQSEIATGFLSARNGEINLLVTASPSFYAKHQAATAVCKRLNLMDKADRIALFQAVLYGKIV